MSTYQNARKDANSVAVLCGISDADGSVMPIQIDPVTGGILAEIYIVTEDTHVLPPGLALKDANSSPTLLGIADDASGLLVPVMHHETGYLFADVLEE